MFSVDIKAKLSDKENLRLAWENQLIKSAKEHIPKFLLLKVDPSSISVSLGNANILFLVTYFFTYGLTQCRGKTIIYHEIQQYALTYLKNTLHIVWCICN